MDGQSLAPLTMALGKMGLTAGTTTTLTTSPVGGATSMIFAIRGKVYSQANWTNQATPTTDFATGAAFKPILANQGCAFLVGLDHSGTMRVIQGTIVNLDTVSSPGAFLNASTFGALGAAGSDKTTANDFCPIGYLLIQAGSTANNTTGWTFGSSNMSGVTGITYTFDDVIGIPDRPQTS